MIRRSAVLLPALLCCPALCLAQAQQPTRQMPPDYRGPQIRVPGIFVTPVPNAPFTADVDIISHQKLPDGTENVRTTTVHIARDSSGRIYNEARMLVPSSFKGEPRLLSAHIFNPADRLNIFYDPSTRIARESILRPAVVARQMPLRPPVPTIGDPWGGAGVAGPGVYTQVGGPTSNPGAATALNNPGAPPQPQTKETDLGEQMIDGTTLHGTEKQLTLPAEASSTGKPITITTEYWYSPDLSVYLIVKHNDPRYGEQIVAVTHIDRHEPPSVTFRVPDIYKVVDETPPPPQPMPTANR
jgi:hypothetical protein